MLLLEGTFLFVFHRMTHRGVSPADLIANLLAGMFLLLALRAALTEADWVWLALFLLGAFAAHLADLARRWRR
jgi:hypothetical protein